MKVTSNQLIIGAVVVLVLAGGAWWFFIKPAGSGTVATSTASSSGDTSGATSGADSAVPANPTTGASGEVISVQDQPEGDSVSVGPIVLTKAGWVAVRDDMRILGAARLDAGTTQNIFVPLLRNTTTGTKYQAVLYVDDGDRQFDFKKDALVEGVSASFTALHGD